MTYPYSSRQIVKLSWRRSMVAVLVCAVLNGCASLTGPDRLKIPANTSEFRSRLYAGAAIGNSRLSPDTRGTVFNVDSSSDMGTQLRLGYDVHNMLAVEIDSSVLGASQLREAGTDVKYSSVSVSALIYGLSGTQLRSRREGLSAYARLGYGSLSKSSAVLALEDSGAVPIMGLGAEYGFSNGLGLRAEITRFDEDASYIGFGAIYRFGISPKGIGQMIAQAAEPALGAAHTTVAQDGRVLTGPARNRFDSERRGHAAAVGLPRGSQQGDTDDSQPDPFYAPGQQPSSDYTQTMADRWRPAMRAGDMDRDGVMDTADNCPETSPHVTVNRFGCGLFDAVLEDVTFKSGSRWLTPRARGQLDRVAETLLAFPESRVQVRAHTDSMGPADMNLNLSSRRSEVVVQYLQSRGVNELQLQAVGMGEAQPLDSNGSPAGRRRNRRVDIVTLPDQDAGQLLVAANVDSARVIAIADPGKRDPARDDYRIDADEWNSAPALPVKGRKSSLASKGKAVNLTPTEPALKAATPAGTDEADAPVKTENSGSVTDSSLLPLPEPGFAPGLGIAGVVEGLVFETGSATLSAASKNSLAHISTALLNNPDVRIAVMAHTDDDGDQEENLQLSRVRAQAVVAYLVEQGVAPERLEAEGYGELLPLVQNVTEEDRARNRRIEIRIIRKP
jgi:outer membrane protein OmpA-like peptidoglycan-associated protein